MSLNIKNQETERLARELADATGESLTEAIGVAVRERLDHIAARRAGVAGRRAERLRAIAADAATRWVEPYRTADHAALLYDERGLPR